MKNVHINFDYNDYKKTEIITKEQYELLKRIRERSQFEELKIKAYQIYRLCKKDINLNTFKYLYKNSN